MRILVTASPWLGGSGTVGSELAKRMALKHQTYFLSFDFPVRGKDKEENFMFYNLTPFSYALFPHPLYSESLAERMIELVLRHDIQVIHAHYSLVFGTSAVMAKRALEKRGKRIKLVTTFHGTDAIGFDPRRMGQKAFGQLNRWILDESDVITVGSRFMKRFLRSQYGPRGRIEVVPNFVDLSFFRKTNGFAERDTLLHVSNFRPVKRPLEVVKAFALLRKTYPRLKLALVGQGPELEKIRRFVDVKRLSGVRFVGMAEADRVREEMNRALAFVLPSSFENAALTLLEAAACGTPQITTDVGGSPELVQDRKTGILIPNQDHLAKEIASAFEKIIDQKTWEGMSVRSVFFARRFDLDTVVDQYETLYRSLLIKKPSRFLV